MPKSCGSWEELTDAVQQRCTTILDKKVAPIVKEIVRRHIETDIYGAYTPQENAWFGSDGRSATYARRRLLLKRGSIYHKSSDGELLVTSNAPASPPIVNGWTFKNKPGGFLQMLETGNMGIWRSGFPRPAIGNAQKEIDKSSQISRVIREELKK